MITDSLDGLKSRLSLSASISLDEYFSTYIHDLAGALEYCATPDALKSSISAEAFAANPDILRFSLIFNELTQVVLPTEGMQLIVPQGPGAEKAFGSSGIALNIENSYMEELGLTPEQLGGFCPAFILPEGEHNERLINELSPIIHQGRLIVTPKRALMYLEKTDASGRRHWKLLNVRADSPLTAWTIVTEQTKDTIPIVGDSTADFAMGELFEIALPYLTNISYAKLALVLADEADLISSLRVSIKTAIEETKGSNVVSEVIQDVINPKLDMLERKLKGLLARYAVSLAGASIATVGLAYTAATSPLSLPAALAGLAGAGGLAIASKEYVSWKEKQAALKDDPFYFLWRCKKAKR